MAFKRVKEAGKAANWIFDMPEKELIELLTDVEFHLTEAVSIVCQLCRRVIVPLGRELTERKRHG